MNWNFDLKQNPEFIELMLDGDVVRFGTYYVKCEAFIGVFFLTVCDSVGQVIKFQGNAYEFKHVRCTVDFDNYRFKKKGGVAWTTSDFIDAVQKSEFNVYVG